jgi:hypothetical protein
MLTVWSVVALLLALSPAGVLGAPRVEMEVATEGGIPPTAAHEWLAVLKDLGLSGLRIRAARPGERPMVTGGDAAQVQVYRVTGILTQGNRLRLPGGVFSIRDRARIADWIDRLAKGGQEELTARPAAFGLTGKQLVELHDSLAVKVDSVTEGKRVSAVVGSIGRSIALEIEADPGAEKVLAAEETVGDELIGVSGGTALAAAIRPLGLVLVPHKQRGKPVRLFITDARNAPESWPVGWPPEKKPRELLPKLFEFVTVEITEIPLGEALAALQKRLDVPFLMDHNSLARHRVEPARVNVTMPAGRTYYRKVLDRLLFQAKLKAELRVDEAGEPFLWITTIKQ